MSNNQTPQRPATPPRASRSDARAASRLQQLREKFESTAQSHGLDISVPESIASDVKTSEGRARVAKSMGADAASQLSRKYGVDADAAKVVETAQSLATEDGRLAAMKELGVHMSGRLAEKYGIEDAEAKQLLDSSRALRTREGRQSLLSQYAGNVEAENLMAKLHDRHLTISDRRELVNSLLQNDKVTGTVKKAAKGLVVGAVCLLAVLVFVLIGAVALLSWLFHSGGGDAQALAQWADATRPGWEWFAHPLGSA